MAELKKALEGTDESAVSEIKAATEKVASVSQKLGAALYAEQQAAGAGAPGPGSEAGTGGTEHGDEDVVEAEIVDEDEQK